MRLSRIFRCQTTTIPTVGLHFGYNTECNIEELSTNQLFFHSFNNNKKAAPIQIQSVQQQMLQQVDQLANVMQSASVGNELEDSVSPTLQNDVQVNDLGVQTAVDVDAKDDLSGNEQNNLTDEPLSSKQLSNEPKTYAQFFKSDNFSNNISSYSSATAANRTANASKLGAPRSSTRSNNPVRGRAHIAIRLQLTRIYSV